MFAKDSRYADLEELNVTDANGRTVRACGPRFSVHTEPVLQHAITEGERLDTLAHQYYEKSNEWWRICESNPDVEWPPDLLANGVMRTLRSVLPEPENATTDADLNAKDIRLQELRREFGRLAGVHRARLERARNRETWILELEINTRTLRDAAAVVAQIFARHEQPFYEPEILRNSTGIGIPVSEL